MQSDNNTNNNEWITVTRKSKHKKTPFSQNTEVSTPYNQGHDYLSLHQDWNDITLSKKNVSTKNKVHFTPNTNAIYLNNLDNQTDAFKLKHVDKALSKKIIDYRKVNNLTQVQLAHKLNLKLDIISSYENGSAIPNDLILNKFHRLLNKQSK